MENQDFKQVKRLPQQRMRRLASFKLRLRLQLLLWQRALPSLTPALNWQTMTAVMVFFSLLSTSVSAYAYTNTAVTAASPLYPIKTGLEQVELALGRTEAYHAQTHLKLANRRLQEAKQLAQDPKHSHILANTLGNLKYEITNSAPERLKNQAINEDFKENIETLAREVPIDDENVEVIVGLAETADILNDADEDEQAGEQPHLIQNADALDEVVVEDLPSQETLPADNATPDLQIDQAPQTTQKPQLPVVAGVKVRQTNNEQSSQVSQDQPTRQVEKAQKTETLKIRRTPTQVFEQEIKIIKRQVTALKKEREGASSSERSKTESLVTQLHKQVNRAEESAKKNDLAEALKISRSTKSVIKNVELFVSPAKPLEQPSQDKKSDQKRSESKKTESKRSESQKTETKRSATKSTETKTAETKKTESQRTETPKTSETRIDSKTSESQRTTESRTDSQRSSQDSSDSAERSRESSRD